MPPCIPHRIAGKPRPWCTISARRVYPSLFGWHWSHDCLSHQRGHSGHVELKTQDVGNLVAQSGTPPIPPYTSMGPSTLGVVFCIIGISFGYSVLIVVCISGHPLLALINGGGVITYTFGPTEVVPKVLISFTRDEKSSANLQFSRLVLFGPPQSWYQSLEQPGRADGV